MGLDTTQTNIAYLMGRLFALLERIQETALKEVNASVGTKYINSVLSAPHLRFPTLLRMSKMHMEKSVDRYQRKKLNELEKIQREVLGKFEMQSGEDGDYMFPDSMDANMQGIFMVAYHHQWQAFYDDKQGGGAEDTPAPATSDE